MNITPAQKTLMIQMLKNHLGRDPIDTEIGNLTTDHLILIKLLFLRIEKLEALINTKFPGANL